MNLILLMFVRVQREKILVWKLETKFDQKNFLKVRIPKFKVLTDDFFIKN